MNNTNMTNDSQPTDDAWNTYFQRIHERRRSYSEQKRREFIAVRRALRAANVCTILCEYSGSGDSGGIESIYFRDKDNNIIDNVAVTAHADVVIPFVESLLPCGFEVNEGGQGELTLCLNSRTYTLMHGDNYTEVEHTTKKGRF